jgi:hypothetical protein
MPPSAAPTRERGAIVGHQREWSIMMLCVVQLAQFIIKTVIVAAVLTVACLQSVVAQAQELTQASAAENDSAEASKRAADPLANAWLMQVQQNTYWIGIRDRQSFAGPVLRSRTILGAREKRFDPSAWCDQESDFSGPVCCRKPAKYWRIPHISARRPQNFSAVKTEWRREWDSNSP